MITIVASHQYFNSHVKLFPRSRHERSTSSYRKTSQEQDLCHQTSGQSARGIIWTIKNTFISRDSGTEQDNWPVGPYICISIASSTMPITVHHFSLVSPEYWLNGWFSRRRRKSRINNGTIATFKAEYQDPAVPPASSTVLPSSVSTNASASAPVEPPLKKPRLPPTSSTAAPPGVNSNASASAPVGRPPKKPRNRKKVIPASSKTQALPAIKTEHQDAATIPPAAPPTISPGASSLDACLANAMHQGYVLDSFTHRWANSLKRGLPEDVHQVEPATAQGMLDFRTNAAVPPVPPVSDPSVFCSPDLRPNANSQATHTPEQHQTSTRPPPSNQALGSKKTTTATPIQSRKPGANTPAAHVPRAIQPNLKPLPWSYLYYDPVQKCTFTVPAAHIRPDTATSNLQSMLGSPFQPTPMIPRPHEILGMGYASARPAIKPFSSGVQHSSSSTPSSTHPHVYGQPRPGGICTDRAPLEVCLILRLMLHHVLIFESLSAPAFTHPRNCLDSSSTSTSSISSSTNTLPGSCPSPSTSGSQRRDLTLEAPRRPRRLHRPTHRRQLSSNRSCYSNEPPPQIRLPADRRVPNSYGIGVPV